MDKVLLEYGVKERGIPEVTNKNINPNYLDALRYLGRHPQCKKCKPGCGVGKCPII